jgi:phospholipase C
MKTSRHTTRGFVGLLGTVALALVGVAAGQGGAAGARPHPPTLPGGYRHLVVIYEENHSFDNLYGHWGSVGGQRVDGIAAASAQSKQQVAQDGTPFRCLLQVDVNLAAPSPQASTCHDAAHAVPDSHFRNHPFRIDRYIRPRDKTCPAPGVAAPNGVPKGSPGARPGGCTRDLVHRFYQEQFQIDGGHQDRYVTGSDAAGLTMGTYRTGSCRSTATCTPSTRRTTSWPTGSSRPRSAARSSTTSS